MKLFKPLTILSLVIACAIVSIACSNGKLPVTPATDDISGISSGLPISFGTDIDNRNLLAVYDAVIDPSAKTFTITPDTRSAQYHYALTQMFPSVLKITGYGFTPNLWADIKLVHPYPGSGIKGYDPRVIAILPANPGVRFIYPTLGVGGNNAVVLEPDGYTKLFDSLGGSIPGNVNPFKAYFKDQPYRVWSGTGVTEETQRWQMNLAGFGGPLQFKLIVDVSTNYPAPPQSVIDNVPEPVQIDATIGSGLTTDGGSAQIDVVLLDWQGQSGIGGVQIEAPDLFTGTVSLVYSESGPNPNEYICTGTITNTLLSPEGEYKLLVATWDQTTGIYIYDEFDCNVSAGGFNPVDVTPDWLDFTSYDVCADENYLYAAASYSGLYIFDISDLTDPSFVKQVDTDGEAKGVYVSDGYAYIADQFAGLAIIDVNPIEDAYVVNSVYTTVYAEGVYASGGYAYVAAGSYGLEIIDVDPPLSASIVKTVDTPGYAEGVFVSDGYAYVPDVDYLRIIDVEPIGSASIVNSVASLGTTRGVEVRDGYAYLADWGAGLEIIDVSAPESASIVKTVDTPGYAWGVFLSDGYAYIADDYMGLQIIDVDPIADASVVSSLVTPDYAYAVCVSGNYAFVADGPSGVRVIKLW